MSRTKLTLLLLVAAIAVAWFVFHKQEARTLIVQKVEMTNVVKLENDTARAQPTPAPAEIVTNSPTDANFPPGTMARYRQGVISKEEAMQEIILSKNETVQNMYGKVIDQYGQPVVSADVAGNLILERGVDADEQVKKYGTQSDAAGLFEFTGLQGAKLGVTVSKQGYLMGGHGEGYAAPNGGNSSPEDRAVFTMWKLRGPQQLLSGSFESVIPSDGTSALFDLAAQNLSPDGDLRVTLSRSPSEVRRSGQRFDWDVKIEMIRGGLAMENASYPYWAPESGYMPMFEANMSSNNVPWESKFEQGFYFKNSQGQYGRMRVTVYSALTPAKVAIEFCANPTGSQNLEPQQGLEKN